MVKGVERPKTEEVEGLEPHDWSMLRKGKTAFWVFARCLIRCFNEA